MIFLRRRLPATMKTAKTYLLIEENETLHGGTLWLDIKHMKEKVYWKRKDKDCTPGVHTVNGKIDKWQRLRPCPFACPGVAEVDCLQSEMKVRATSTVEIIGIIVDSFYARTEADGDGYA